MARETDVAWAAGFMDGEGSILIRKFNTTFTKYGLSIQITQETKEPLDKMLDLFGGVIGRQRSSGKLYYRYRLYANKANDALIEMLPHLTVKRDQALLVVNEFRPLVVKIGGRQTQENRDKMAFLYERIRDIRKEAKLNA